MSPTPAVSTVSPSAPADGGKHEGKGGEDHGN